MSGNMIIIPIPLGLVHAYVVKQNGMTILIDTGMRSSIKLLLDNLRSLHIDLKDISYIIITHAHTDHYGSLALLKRLSGAKVITSKHEAQFIERGLNSEIILHQLISRMVLRFIRLPVQPCQVDIIVERDEFDLSPYGIKGRIIHTPGHTRGCISILLDERYAIIGDLVTPNWFSRKLGYPGIYFDIRQLKSSIYKIIGHDPKWIYPSHSHPVSLQRFKKIFRDEKKKMMH